MVTHTCNPRLGGLRQEGLKFEATLNNLGPVSKNILKNDDVVIARRSPFTETSGFLSANGGRSQLMSGFMGHYHQPGFPRACRGLAESGVGSPLEAGQLGPWSGSSMPLFPANGTCQPVSSVPGVPVRDRGTY